MTGFMRRLDREEVAQIMRNHDQDMNHLDAVHGLTLTMRLAEPDSPSRMTARLISASMGARPSPGQFETLLDCIDAMAIPLVEGNEPER